MQTIDSIAETIARRILTEFNVHYSRFLNMSRQVKYAFESASWKRIQKLHSDRIFLYDSRVIESIESLKRDFGDYVDDDNIWLEIKQHYRELLFDHSQPELAESFYNSLFCRLFHRRYYNNNYIFFESVSQEQSHSSPEPVTVKFALNRNVRDLMQNVLQFYGLKKPFINMDRDLKYLQTLLEAHPIFKSIRSGNAYVELLASAFYRNKGCYLVGRLVVNQTTDIDQDDQSELLVKEVPFVVPILHKEGQGLYADTLLLDPNDMAIVFSFARAYFFVDTLYPGAMVNFLAHMMPSKSEAELYTAIGLQKHGKTQFYRDFVEHLKQTDDQFIVAPGIRGMVMAVFTLPSYPYVYKIIKDKFAPPKEVTKEIVKQKYLLVKQHDRVGRMADTWEYSYVRFPLDRFDPALLEELLRDAPAEVKTEGSDLVVRHLYIERRMKPLNLFIETATVEQKRSVMLEYGNAIKQLAAANIFPGDMLLKNFGVTRHGRVIFYDYDEINYLTESHFRVIPPPRDFDDEMSAEPWYSVGPYDVFPEEFATFIFSDLETRRIFEELHPDLLQASYWQSLQDQLKEAVVTDVIPYSRDKRQPWVLAEEAAASG